MASLSPERIRAFIAIAIEPALAKEVREVQQRLNSPGGVVRWSNPDHLHLTLQFLGNVPVERLDDLAAALRRACAHTAPFRLALEGVGCFPNTKAPRVVWLGNHGDLVPLQGLQRQIASATKGFGDHGDEHVFQPHLTIGRVKTSGVEAQRVGQTIAFATVPKLGDWPVHQVLLVRSELSPDGPRYSTLEAVALGH